MAGPLYYDLVEETTSTGGTGTFTLAGATTGHRTWASTVGANNTAYYMARGSTFAEWEVGLGTVGASGTTLARTTILASSNGGSAVTFTSTVTALRCVLPASVIGNLQPLDATLTALAAQNWALNAVPVGTGTDTLTQLAITSNTFLARASTGNVAAKIITDYGLSLVDDATAGEALTTLGLTANGQSLVTAANYAAMRTLLGVDASGTVPTQITVVDAADDATCWVALARSQTGNQAICTDAEITYNASTGILAVNISGSSASTTGNAATVTTNANLTGPITSVGNATSIASQTGTGTTFAMSASPSFTGNVFLGVGASGAGNLALSFTGDTNTGLYHSASDEMRLQTGGVDAVTVDASQNVIVGNSTTSAALSVTVKSNSSGVFGYKVTDASGNELVNLTANGSTGEVKIGGVRVNYFPTFFANGSEAARITTGGLFGINTGSSVGAQLQVTSSAAGTIGQIIKLAATPSAHALDVNSSSGSGGDLAYISETGAGFFAGGVTVTTPGTTSTSVPTLASTSTFTNKTMIATTNVVEEITSTASSATPTPTGGSLRNLFTLTALAVGATIAAPSGTPVDGNYLTIRIKDSGGAQSLGYNAIYAAVGVTAPTTTVAGKWLYMGLRYNGTASKWHILSVAQEA